MKSKTYNKDDDANAKSSNKRRGSKSKTRSKSTFNKDAKLRVDNRDNDPNWYFTSPELANQAAQLSFQSLLGTGSLYGYKVPSITRIDTVMNPGVTYRPQTIMHRHFGTFDSMTLESVSQIDGNKAGVNLMAAKLYTTLSSFTGRTASYGPQDVAMMILQISAIAEFSETIRRAFGLALTYNFRNRSLPMGIIRSMGLDPIDMSKNLSIYRMRFNVAMSRINQIPLLENIAFIKKARDVYQRIYMDDPTDMSQIFYYMPTFTYKLDEAGDDDGSILRADGLVARNGSATMTMELWLDKLESMITAALESSTLNFIYADLLNMANKLSVQTWQFDYLAENYVVMPEYNANALLQFHNLTVMGRPVDIIKSSTDTAKVKAAITSLNPDHLEGKDIYVTSGANVYCNAATNEIVYNPGFTTKRGNLWSWFVDMPTNNPSIEDRIEAIRYVSVNTGNFIVPGSIGNGLITENIYIFNALPDHYVADFVTFDNIDVSNLGTQGDYIDSTLLPTDSGTSFNSKWTKFAAWNSQFEHAPAIGTVKPNDASVLQYIFGGLQYYTQYDAAYVMRLLDITTVGLFDFRVK